MPTLIAFGDSHVAGSEIEFKNQNTCFHKSFAAKIAEHYSFEYENYSQPGGSNDYIIKKLIPRVKTAIKNSENIFLVIGICDSSRTYYYYNNNHYHVTPNMNMITYPKIVSRAYSDYISLHSNADMEEKALNQILFIQSFLKIYKIPYIMFSTRHFSFGDWTLIDQCRYYGHHVSKKDYYTEDFSSALQKSYSYWGTCLHHPRWAHLIKQDRWRNHYPEDFHTFWAETMISFINTNNLLSY